MGKDTFKLAIMLRLSPVPSWVNNYGLSLTPISLRYEVYHLFRNFQFHKITFKPLTRFLKPNDFFCSFREFFLATILAGFPGVVRNVYIGSLMKSVSAPDAEDAPIWVHIIMGSLTIVASILVTKYLYKYFRMAMGSDPVQPKDETDDLENNKKGVEHTPTPPPETVTYPPSPLPTRQRIVNL